MYVPADGTEEDDILVTKPGTQAAAHSRMVLRCEASLRRCVRKTVSRTTMEMMRMLKSTAWTLNWPTQALITHEGVVSALPLRVWPSESTTAPDMVLLRLLMKSGDDVSFSFSFWFPLFLSLILPVRSERCSLDLVSVHTCDEEVQDERMPEMPLRRQRYVQDERGEGRQTGEQRSDKRWYDDGFDQLAVRAGHLAWLLRVMYMCSRVRSRLVCMYLISPFSHVRPLRPSFSSFSAPFPTPTIL